MPRRPPVNRSCEGLCFQALPQDSVSVCDVGHASNGLLRGGSYWGAFVRQGIPSDKTDAAWPIFNAAGQLMSLHPNDRSFVRTFDRTV
jgi:hypothetical protein